MAVDESRSGHKQASTTAFSVPEDAASMKPDPSDVSKLERKLTGVAVEDFKPSKRLFAAFLTLAVMILMVALDGTSLSVALPIISQKLRGTAIEAFWSGTSFLLCSTVFQPNFASFSHIFGRKPMVYLSLGLFLVGAIVAAVSNSFGSLLVGRSLQGIGGGGILALTEIIVTDLVPLRLRGKYFGIVSAMWSLGSVTGPIVGGGFSENATWRWIFYINLPFIGVAFPMVFLLLKQNFKRTQLGQQLRRVDWIGSVIFIGSTTSFLIPVTWGGVSYHWSSWRTLVPLLIGVAGLIAFVLYEALVAPEPLIRLSIFSNATSAAAYFQTVIHGMILWSILYYLPLYYEGVKGQTPILSGVSLFPETFTVAPAALVTGIIITKTGRYRFAIYLGWLLTILGTGLLYLQDVHTPTAEWIFLNLTAGLGMGMLFPSMNFAVQAASRNADLAFAVAMFTFFRAFGQSLGVAVGGTIFQNQIKKSLLASPDLAPLAADYARDAAALVQIIRAMSDDQSQSLQQAELRQAYADALKIVWISMCALAAVAGLSSYWIRGLDLNRPLNTEQGFRDRGERERDEEKVDGQ